VLFGATVLWCAFITTPLGAHPIPKDNHDRTISVWLTRQAVVVYYRLELDEGRAARDLTEEERSQIHSLADLYRVFTRSQGPVLAQNLDAQLDAKPLPFACVEQGYRMPEMGHLVCDYRFEAPWSLSSQLPGRFAFHESNYSDDDFSRLQVTLQASSVLDISDINAPNQALWQRPAVERGPGDDKRLRRLAATVSLLDHEPLAESKPLPPTDPDPPHSPPRGKLVAQARSAPTDVVSWAKPSGSGGDLQQGPVVEQDSSNLLHLLLDTNRGFAILLLLAAGLGAAHALTPGHGKTLVAAYLVGERGTIGHALLLGLVTTLTHTGAVLALAGIGYFFPHAFGGTMLAAQLIGGLAIVLLGFWLLLRRVSGQADHVHLGRHHHHHHGHGHSHTPDYPELSARTAVSWWHLIVLGMQGGIVPCADAVVILAGTATAGRIGRALPLLLAFSAGLAGVLVGLGIAVVGARKWARRTWGDHPRLKRLSEILPLLSAVVIMGMGLWLCYSSVHPGQQLPGARAGTPPVSAPPGRP
jgi:ABC-type nickel/cobalt efflux system permease component RcnA